MSSLRQCLQQISRHVSATIPKNIRFVNPDIIDKYQKIQDATLDFYKQRNFTQSGNNPKMEKFNLLRKMMRYVFYSVCAGATYQEIKPSTTLVPTSCAAKTKSKSEKSTTSKTVDNQVSFSDRKVIEYENRLRNYSTPEKIFRYFATICLVSEKGTEIVMTPADFLRSIYPGKKQPRQFGLDRFRRIERNEISKLNLNIEKESAFLKLGFNGLITFPDYLFLMTVLTTSSRHFEIAFQMFDINGDGVLVAQEFEGVTSLARQSATFAATGHDTYRKGRSIGLMKYFFGADLKGKLSIKDFLKFQHDLKNEILSLEFDNKPKNEYGLISESDFADLLIAYAGYNLKVKDEKLRRVRKHFKNNTRGISKQDYLDFWNLLNNLNDVEMALSFYHLAGASIDKATLQHVAKTVVKIQLSEHAVDVAFAIFDENNDDQLSKHEFVDAMKKRLYRGMTGRRHVNFIEIIHALKKCALERRTYDF